MSEKRKLPGASPTFLATLLLLSLLAAEKIWAREFNPQGWPVPSLYGAHRYYDDTYDFDYNFPGKETRLEKFRGPEGALIWKYSYDNNVYCYAVNVDGKGAMDYAIVDFDGDGVFEIRQSPYDRFPLPKWTYQD